MIIHLNKPDNNIIRKILVTKCADFGLDSEKKQKKHEKLIESITMKRQ